MEAMHNEKIIEIGKPRYELYWLTKNEANIIYVI